MVEQMEQLVEVLRKNFEHVNARFETDEKHIQAMFDNIVKAFAQRDTALLEYRNAILELQKQVKELQGNAADRIILEDKHEHAEVLGPGDEYRANTNDR